jgi:penicillin-binding protein 2
VSVNDDRPLLDPGAAGVSPRQLWRRFILFGLAVVIVVTGLGVRLFQLQVTDAERYTALAVQRRQRTVSLPVTRGLIYDRRGRQLVENVPEFVVRITPGAVPFAMRDAVTERLAELLEMDPVDIYRTLDGVTGSTFDPLTLKTDISERVARIIAEEHLGLPGVTVDVTSRRRYPYGRLLSHVLGWTGRVSAEELERHAGEGYLVEDTIGKAGVELTFERELRGTYGVDEVQRDAGGRVVSVLRTLEEPHAGDSIQLTIDLRMQREAQRALQWGMRLARLQRGVFLVMNPQNGEILAMVSLPSYDNNMFSGGISAADYKKLLNHPQKPLVNHAISDQYPPGSTYKLVAGTGVLADDKITPSTRIRTAGYLTLGGARFRDWNDAGFGLCNIYCGFGHSSDTFFYQAAAMLGIDRLGFWAKQYGFGAPTGIDLPAEASGIVPTNQWKIDEFGLPIYPGEVYHAGIGQGYDAVTPLQLLNAYATLANGGTLYKPHVVSQIIAPDGTVTAVEPQVLNDHKASASTLRVMRHAARNVPVIRHTYNLVDLPIVVAGKTGTAEFGTPGPNGDLPFHNWFVSFVPKDPWKKASDPNGFKAVERGDSELAVLVFAYNAGTLGNAATETAKYFYQLHFDIKKDYRLPYLMKPGPYYRA